VHNLFRAWRDLQRQPRLLLQQYVYANNCSAHGPWSIDAPAVAQSASILRAGSLPSHPCCWCSIRLSRGVPELDANNTPSKPGSFHERIHCDFSYSLYSLLQNISILWWIFNMCMAFDNTVLLCTEVCKTSMPTVLWQDGRVAAPANLILWQLSQSSWKEVGSGEAQTIHLLRLHGVYTCK